MSGKAVEQAAAAGQSFEEAHRHVLADRNIQLDMLPVKQPDPPPQWLIDFFKWLGKALEPVGEFLNWIGSFLPDAPYARILFWGLIVLLAAAIIWMVVERLRSEIGRAHV